MQRVAILGFCGLALLGCAVEADAPPPHRPAMGTLVVDWSISGVQDVSACRQSDADVISIVIDGVGEFEEPCEAFQTSIDLRAGSYSGDAVLLDPSGGARTTAVDLGPVDILGHDQLVVPIDFPSDSFY